MIFKSYARKTISNIVIVGLIALINFSHFAYASSHLVDPHDLIAVTALGARVQHAISFGLPIGGGNPELETTDYVVLKMDNFTNITEPSYVSGPYGGYPVFSVVGKEVRTTGISLHLGENLTIQGVAATNPTTSEDDMFMQIRICADADCSLIKYDDSVQVARSTNKVTMKAAKAGEVGSLKISGLASPGMFLSFFEGGNSMGATMANVDGSFSQEFRGLPPTTHTITIYGQDLVSRATPAVILQDILTKELAPVEVNNVLIPPTIAIDKEQIDRGQTIKVTGSGAPDHKSIIFTEPPLQTMEAQTNLAAGEYQYDFSDTNDLEYGDHKMYAILQNSHGEQSHQSVMLFYRVNSGSEPPDPGTGSCDISRANLNCDSDSKIDLADFSILMYYWGSNSVAADINADGNVNLIDFSIMMFYWGS